MITIEFTKEGKAISDFETEDFVRTIVDSIDTGDITYKISTSIAVTAIRAAVKQEKIPYDQIQFLFENKIIEVNRFGRIIQAPDGFADLYDDLLGVILGI